MEQKLVYFYFYYTFYFSGHGISAQAVIKPYLLKMEDERRNIMKTMKKTLLLCSVLICMLLIIPGALAGTTGSAAVSGNPTPTLDLTVIGSNSFPGMVIGPNVNVTSNNVTVTVVSNTNWSVGVHDALDGPKPGPSVGKMAEWDGTSAYVSGGKVLTNAFEVGSDASTWVTLTGSSLPLYTNTVAGTTVKYPFFRQNIVTEDQSLTSPNTYRMVVTFTAAQA